VRVFRRNSAGARGSTAQDPKGAQSPGAPDTTKTAGSEAARTARPAEAGKGRPTPKRSEAERGRRQGITGSPGRPGPSRGGGGRAESRTDRSRRYEAMKRGEEWALPARDRGPVKALARDYVDSHRRPSEYYMYVMVAVLIMLLVIRAPAVQQIAEPVVLLLLILFVVVDATLLRISLQKLIGQRLPGESLRGVTMYAVLRALQIRKLRSPAPRVRPGDKI
jgi:Protein of unknown function (DUF3043)